MSVASGFLCWFYCWLGSLSLQFTWVCFS